MFSAATATYYSEQAKGHMLRLKEIRDAAEQEYQNGLLTQDKSERYASFIEAAKELKQIENLDSVGFSSADHRNYAKYIHAAGREHPGLKEQYSCYKSAYAHQQQIPLIEFTVDDFRNMATYCNNVGDLSRKQSEKVRCFIQGIACIDQIPEAQLIEEDKTHRRRLVRSHNLWAAPIKEGRLVISLKVSGQWIIAPEKPNTEVKEKKEEAEIKDDSDTEVQSVIEIKSRKKRGFSLGALSLLTHKKKKKAKDEESLLPEQEEDQEAQERLMASANRRKSQ